MLKSLVRNSLLVAVRRRQLTTMPLTEIEDVELDPQGTFKYILINCTEKSGQSKYVVRGWGHHTFHADIYDEMKSKKPSDVKTKCVGGGRIKHTPEKKELFVYGYSQGYGQADHTVTVDILKQKYPDYNITYSNDGY